MAIAIDTSAIVPAPWPGIKAGHKSSAMLAYGGGT
jgi:hypothetical protein